MPLGTWFSRPELRPFLSLPLEQRATNRGWWNPRELRNSIEFHLAGAGSDDSAESVPWIAANLELWARIFLDGDSPDLYTV